MKKITAVVLAVIMTFSVSVTTFAADEKCNCGFVPVIYVTGFAYTPLAANVGTDDEYDVFIPDSELIVNCLVQMIVPVVKLLMTGNYSDFASSLAASVKDMLKDVACDDNGVPLNDTVDVVKRDEPSSSHWEDSQQTFRYDWREDVFDIASELNDYIQEVKELTGHDKVALKAESMGGAVVMTYLKVYGSESIDTIVMQSAAYNGITLMGGLFTGDIEIKSQSAIDYVGNFIEGNDVKTTLLRVLYYTFGNVIFSPVTSILDNVIIKTKDQLYNECLCDILGNIPGIWTFVPQENYEQAKEFMLDETENAELIKKIDAYHYGVMDRTKKLLDSAMANGVKLAIISNYDKAPVFVNHYDKYQSDFLIDTKRTSLGATCADFGEILGEDYVQAVSDGHNHISCDNVVDASTCMYPEYTWFVKDMMHTWYSYGYYMFTFSIIYSDTQQTVYSNPDYPQFLLNNQETGTLDILTTENMNTKSKDVDIAQLFKLIINESENAA